MSVSIHSDGWLSEVIGRPAFKVDAPAAAEALAEAVQRHMRDQANAFYFAKVDCKAVEVVRLLGKAGFFVADVNVTFALDRPPLEAAAPPHRIEVRESTAEDAWDVLDVAGSAFRYTRFHLDPHFPDEAAHRIKRAWIESYVAKRRGDKLWAARFDGRAVGFLAALSTKQGDKRVATIDLIAVATAQQGKQVGRRLVEAFGAHYRDHDVLQVGTQAANVPSIRLYERMGYSLWGSQYVLHLHVRDGRPLP